MMDIFFRIRALYFPLFALFLAKIDLPFLRASADDDAPQARSDNNLRVNTLLS